MEPAGTLRRLSRQNVIRKVSVGSDGHLRHILINSVTGKLFLFYPHEYLEEGSR